ncbi:SAM-dependent methyltransferase [Streptomyces syringium]|uniref:tRNA (Thr-GGU) A37 N-methylase n=1 Tax=Streptomyces syringium TaxID=76729 RepID=A0ABS4XW50_9ACTN|nr:SAM-dependent methyltransferase [Streptomyces syringium]MBP2400736.1 tRNA (Thr-GGU) A37 N-methylase [Streptomyces syringium]
MSTASFEVRPIGTVVGGRTEPTDDHWGGVRSVIRLDAGRFPAETVQGLEEFSHLLVTWCFHLASPDDVALHARSPRNNPQWPATGTFVHRNHRRPNQLATSFPRLLRVEGLDLHVQDLDAVEGTPVVDLAPYFEEFGPRGEVTQPRWPSEMLKDYWKSPGGM